MSLEGTSLTVNSDGTAKFSVNMVGNKTMQTYIGDFECSCVLSAIDYVNAHKDFVSTIGIANRVLTDPDEVAYALIQLKYRLNKWGPFWSTDGAALNGSHLRDYNVILHINKMCEKAEIEYEKMMKAEYEKTKDKIAKQREEFIKRQMEEAAKDKEIKEAEADQDSDVNLPE